MGAMKQNNKGRRQELKKLKFLRRLKLYGLLQEWIENKGNFNGFRTTGKPCSCFICSGHKKYKRHLFKEETEDLITKCLQEQYPVCYNNSDDR
jgi:hypothetical protein